MKSNKKRLNIVDIIIILFIVFIIGYGIVSAVEQMKSGGSSVNITYVVKTDKIKTEIAEKLSVGDKIYSEEGVLLGQVENAELAAASYEGFNSEGTPVYTRMDGYSILYITISTEASEISMGYEVDGVLISVGEEYAMNAPSLYFEGECVKTSKTEKN